MRYFEKIKNSTISFVQNPRHNSTLCNQNTPSYLYNLKLQTNLTHFFNPTKIQKNDFATLCKAQRLAPATYIPKAKIPPENIDPETGKFIMRITDISGKNHYLLINFAYKHPLYYEVLGSFTSSSGTWLGVPSRLVSPGINLDHMPKDQYLNFYPISRLILKSAVRNFGIIKWNNTEFQAVQVLAEHNEVSIID